LRRRQVGWQKAIGYLAGELVGSQECSIAKHRDGDLVLGKAAQKCDIAEGDAP
jgi:hypothetical protein